MGRAFEVVGVRPTRIGRREVPSPPNVAFRMREGRPVLTVLNDSDDGSRSRVRDGLARRTSVLPPRAVGPYVGP